MIFENATKSASYGGRLQSAAQESTDHPETHAHHVCRSELFSYETCIFYTVLTSVPTLDRVSLKSKVVDAPEILTVIESIPHLSTYLNALYSCQYADFFKASKFSVARSCQANTLIWHGSLTCLKVTLADFSFSRSLAKLAQQFSMGLLLCSECDDSAFVQAFAAIADQVREDIYLHRHLRYYVREVRVVAYSQVSLQQAIPLSSAIFHLVSRSVRGFM